MPDKYLLINGFLEAVGTTSDSIYFARNNSAVVWGGLKFDNAPDNSHLDYCSISGADGVYGMGGIHCRHNSNPVVSHCRISCDTTIGVQVSPQIVVQEGSNPSISDCVITGGRKGIYLYETADCTISGFTITNLYGENGVDNYKTNLTMIDCTISDVHTIDSDGAGIRSEYGDLTLINCTISNNFSVGSGGGIYCVLGSHTFINCTFSDNSSWDNVMPLTGGGGICFYYADGSLSYCTFYDNFSSVGGGAITINGTGSLSVDHCTIDGNDGNGAASGIWLQMTPTANVSNSIIANNTNGYAILNNSDTLTVEYSDFYGNSSGDIGGNAPTGFGVLDRVNYNGDSCDCYYDIFMDPMYVDTLNRDFHLTVGSPCIDAGDTAFAYDPDSTITDMGAYYYHQAAIEEDHPREPSLMKLTCFPNPFATQVKISLLGEPGNRSIGEPDLKIYDLSGRLVKKMSLDTCNLSLGAQATWDAKGIAPGVYFLRFEIGDTRITRKLIKLR
jgi:parallel beta-helix repeat protein